MAFWSKALLSQKPPLPGPRPTGLTPVTITPCPQLESGGQEAIALGLPDGCVGCLAQGRLQKDDLAPTKAHRVAWLWPVDLDDVLEGPPADRAASPGLPLEPQATAVAQAHVSTRIDDCVHFTVKAHCALTVLAAGRL